MLFTPAELEVERDDIAGGFVSRQIVCREWRYLPEVVLLLLFQGELIGEVPVREYVL
jgi:hypothetical protein